MSVKLLTEHHFEFLSLKGGCTGLSESTLVKMSHCWKSHVATQYYIPSAALNIVIMNGAAFNVTSYILFVNLYIN